MKDDSDAQILQKIKGFGFSCVEHYRAFETGAVNEAFAAARQPRAPPESRRGHGFC
jgi:hypothetical protein